MNRLFNSITLTETQKNALFAFGEKDKIGTGANLIIAACMCEGELTKAILMNLADLKQIIHDLTSQVATMNVFKSEKYQDLLTKARKIEELWRIKTDDLGYFTVKD